MSITSSVAAQLFERVREVGAEGIVSKRLGSLYRGRESRDWLKTKCHQVGEFVITGFEELGEGRLEAMHVAEEIAGKLVSAGQVRFGFAGKGLWSELDTLRVGPARKGVVPDQWNPTGESQIFRLPQGRFDPRWCDLVSRWPTRASQRRSMVLRQR